MVAPALRQLESAILNLPEYARMLAHRFRRRVGGLLAALVMSSLAAQAIADEVLISDRITNRILRYSAAGEYIGVLTDDTAYLSEPNGMAVTGSMLYVANRQSNSVFGFAYDGYTATNPPIAITTGLNVPASILINDDAEVTAMYISNLGVQFDGATVANLKLDGSPISDDLTGGGPTGRSGLALAPDGSLLVSGFVSGEVLKFNTESNQFESFIAPNQALMGAGNLLVDGNSLYVAAGFTGMVMKFDATTGEPDPAFTPIANLQFPASLVKAPDGNGILVGSLGFQDGVGRIDRYATDGTLIGLWAANSSENPELGFAEATGMVVVPSPEGRAGDTNFDGQIDLEDLNNVRNNFGATGASDGSLVGDAFPYDGVVDLEDLNGVRNNFGGSVESVPEPSAIALALCGLAAIGLIARKR
jgi:hypothetical protein